MGRKRERNKARRVVPTQRDVLRDVMLAAGKYGAWMTLRELGRLTRYGETSISAQLRHLRKAKCGGYVLEKRLRKPEVVSNEEHFVVWEYLLTRRRARAITRAESRRRRLR
jgi:DNA-binding transcriptional regulator GbsR (MarR family)